MSDNDNKAMVQRMWRALGAMDWEGMAACMHPDIHYRDVPSDDPGAHGPKNCIKRLQIAFHHLHKQEQITHHLVAEGDVVFLDHTEIWTFSSGEQARHTFATMHEMREGLVYRWSDYWDMQKFVGQFPDWFLQEMMEATADDFTD